MMYKALKDEVNYLHKYLEKYEKEFDFLKHEHEKQYKSINEEK